jgi:hypothetical protein
VARGEEKRGEEWQIERCGEARKVTARPGKAMQFEARSKARRG